MFDINQTVFRGIPLGNRNFAKDMALQNLARNSEKGGIALPGEEEKTEKQKQYVFAVQAVLREMSRRFGIAGSVEIESERCHFLSSDAYFKNFPNAPRESRGFFASDQSCLCVINDALHRPSSKIDACYFLDFFHECIHLASKRIPGIIFSGNKILSGEYRIGYCSWSWDKDLILFRGWNEGVVCVTQLISLFNFSGIIREHTGISLEDFKDSGYSAYEENQRLVYKIAADISAFRREYKTLSLRRIMRSQFTGELMHLRDLDRIYGPGSFRFLSYYQSFPQSKETLQLNYDIFRYFHVESDLERKSLRAKIESVILP